MKPDALIPQLRELLAELEKSGDETLAATYVNGMEALAHTQMRGNDPQAAVRTQEQAVAYAQAHVKDEPETVLSIRGDLGSLRGRLAGLAGLPAVWRKRKLIQSQVVDAANWRRFMSPRVAPWQVPNRYAHLA